MREHWQEVYRCKAPDQVSWYRPHLETSLAMIERVGGGNRALSIVDVGGGASTLVDDLLERGYGEITVLDIAEDALRASQRRLGAASEAVRWVCGDILRCELRGLSFDIWHDRAVFHFLTDTGDRRSYVRQVERMLRPGGQVILATFGPEGPRKCSGLDTMRYAAESVQAEFGAQFQMVESFTEMHTTPFGTTQQFLYCSLVRGG